MNTKALTILFASILIVLILPRVSLAANWYVDKDATGANNGTSWADAWTSFASIVWGKNGVKAGDTLYISGGQIFKIYNEKWSIGASGISGNPIKIMVGQDPGHNGEVIFDYGGFGNGNGISLAGCNYILIDGNVSGQRKLSIRNFYNPLDKDEAIAISADDSSYITIQNINIDNCNNGIFATYGKGYNINNNYFTNIRGNYAIALYSTVQLWDVNLVHDNYISLSWNPLDGNGGPDGISTYHGTTIYDNKFKITRVNYTTSDQHPDFIQNTGNYVKVYNNDFINIGDSAFDQDAGYDNPSPHDIWIYNNIFRIVEKLDDNPEYIRFYNCENTNINNIKVLNNIFVDNPFLSVYWNCPGSSGSGNELKNNVWYNSSYPWSISDISLGFDYDYNIYYNALEVEYVRKNYPIRTWIESNENHSKTNKPIFVSYSPNSLGNDFHLSVLDTSAKDAGINLSNYFNYDKDGISRPQGCCWDIGAYEYVQAAEPPDTTPPSPPRNLSVI